MMPGNANFRQERAQVLLQGVDEAVTFRRLPAKTIGGHREQLSASGTESKEIQEGSSRYLRRPLNEIKNKINNFQCS